MAKAENKTQPTKKSVREFISAIEDQQMQKDCKTLCKFMEQVTGEKPVLWGDAIIGFGSYHYKYASGREGDFCLIGFSPRKQNMAIYTNCYLEGNDLTKSLGKFKNGKSCLNVKKLEDINLDVLEKILVVSMKRIKEMYP
jgi:Domain of unknown function (DU1801)